MKRRGLTKKISSGRGGNGLSGGVGPVTPDCDDGLSGGELVP